MKVQVLIASAVASVNLFAATVYVNNVLGNDEAYDGSSAEVVGSAGPKKTIQAAIAAASFGDIVSVAPGVYGDEQGSTAAATAGQTCRVWIDRPITLKSERKGGAVIVGRPVSDPQGAVTAIRVASTVATSRENSVEIDGFVIRDCANDASAVGGVIGWSGSGVPSFADEKGPWVVDCVISNCSMTCSGVLGRVNAVRVHLRNNTGTAAGLYAYYCNLAHCVLAGGSGQVGLLGGANNVMVNCSLVGGTYNATSSSNAMKCYNVLVTAGCNGGFWCTETRNSVLVAKNGTGDFDNSNLINANYNKGQLAGPLCADYRPMTKVAGFSDNAVACGQGSAKWLELIPARYRMTDFEGKPISPTEGRIHAGAVQTAVTPVCGFTTTDASLRFDGNSLPAATAAYTRQVYLGSEDWPRAYELSADLPDGQHLFAFGSNDAEAWRFPNRDGKVLYVPEKGRMTTLTAQCAAEVRYVDDVNGSDTNHDGKAPYVSGSTGPFKTIQRAIDVVGSSVYCTIYVAPGVYDEGESEWSEGVTPRLRVMLASNRRCRIVATSTTEPTVIMGQSDTTSATRDANGNGPNAVRCIRVHDKAIGCLQGFTITGGHTDSDKAAYASYKGGGAVRCEATQNFWLMDCLVTNNFAASGGAAMYGGKAARCRFRDNRSTGAALVSYAAGGIYCKLVGCVLEATADRSQSVLADAGVTLVNCSLYSPVAQSRTLTTAAHGYCFNNIIFNNAEIGSAAASACIAGNVLDNTSYGSGQSLNVPPLAYTNGSALFVGPENGDFHVATSSAAIGKGSAWGGLSDTTRWTEAAAYSNFYALVQHDFDGHGFNLVDGKPTAGALQYPTKHQLVMTANRPDRVEPGVVGTRFVGFGESVELSAAATGDRQVVGYRVNGETVAGASYTLTAPGPESSAVLDIQVLVNTNWYVDAENGALANHGWSETDAFQTLSEAMDKAESGDTVVALPGTYREKTMLQESGYLSGDSRTLPSRVVVKDGVALVSRDGAEATVIEGVTPSGRFGAGAVRCVYMRPGSSLRGFTVTGGSTLTYSGSAAGDDYAAGGIFCAEEPSVTVEPTIWVTDCIISNNSARAYAGGAYNGGGFLRCRFFENRCMVADGGASLAARVYECVFDRNVGSSACNRPYRTRGCTFGANNLNWAGNPAPALANDPSSSATLWPVWNSLFLGGPKCAVRCAYNCIVPEEGFLKTDRGTSVWDHVEVASVAVDANYAPAYDSAAANAADMDYVLPVELEGDVYGNPRRSNGGLDVGAVETDWRGRYAKNLGGRRLTVDAADWQVVENADKSVRLPDGASLDCRWKLDGQGSPTVKFTVAAGATLTVSRAGFEPVTFGPGAGELALSDVQALEALNFVAAGGPVDLASFASNSGLLMIIR